MKTKAHFRLGSDSKGLTTTLGAVALGTIAILLVRNDLHNSGSDGGDIQPAQNEEIGHTTSSDGQNLAPSPIQPRPAISAESPLPAIASADDNVRRPTPATIAVSTTVAMGRAAERVAPPVTRSRDTPSAEAASPEAGLAAVPQRTVEPENGTIRDGAVIPVAMPVDGSSDPGIAEADISGGFLATAVSHARGQNPSIEFETVPLGVSPPLNVEVKISANRLARTMSEERRVAAPTGFADPSMAEPVSSGKPLLADVPLARAQDLAVADKPPSPALGTPSAVPIHTAANTPTPPVQQESLAESPSGPSPVAGPGDAPAAEQARQGIDHAMQNLRDRFEGPEGAESAAALADNSADTVVSSTTVLPVQAITPSGLREQSVDIVVQDGEFVSVRLSELIALFEGEMDRSLFVWLNGSQEAGKHVTAQTLMDAGIRVEHDPNTDQLLLSIE